MAANDKQEGGAHYKGERIEHWDFVLMHDIPYMEAQVIKYMMRWRKKNGVEDLRKAKHFIDKLIEHELEQHTEIPVEKTGDVLAQEHAEARDALESVNAMNRYMNPDSGVPRGKGYVDQD
jgi:hypothetical protein